mmetsp:Transcript_13076/g.23889  ORF Transcript_13076/g.23889 Transcript_13076/m.23889 type:complete len:240 (+) Transcript_13076:2387-3106(+)
MPPGLGFSPKWGLKVDPLLLPRHSPLTILFDPQIIDSPNNTEPALLAPIRPPAVPCNPKLDPVLDAPPDDADGVADCGGPRAVLVNASVIILERVRDRHAAHYRASLMDLLHHVGLALHLPILTDVVFCVVRGGEAPRLRGAIPAHVLGGAGVTHVMPRCLVIGTSLVRDAMFLDPPKCWKPIPSVAALVHLVTVQQHLRGETDLGPCCLLSDFDAVAEAGGGRKCPTGPTIMRDVLIA